jgi:hypothetical protein
MLIAGVGAVSIAGVPVTKLPVRELPVESVEVTRGGAMSCMKTTGCIARSSPGGSATSRTGGVA